MPPRSFSLLLAEGHAVGALIHGGVALMGTDQNAVQSTVILILAVVCTLVNSALNALVSLVVHICSSFFVDRDSMADFFCYIPSFLIDILSVNYYNYFELFINGGYNNIFTSTAYYKINQFDINNNLIESSLEYGQPIPFVYGENQMIQGIEEAVGYMKVGGKSRIIVPSNLGFGDIKIDENLPANSTLVIDLEFVDLFDLQK